MYKVPLRGPARVIDSVFKDLLLDAVKEYELDTFPNKKDNCTRQFISLQSSLLVFTTKRSVISSNESQLKVSQVIA